MLYCLVESAKASGIDPISYLTKIGIRAQQSPGSVLLPSDFRPQQQTAASVAARSTNLRRAGTGRGAEIQSSDVAKVRRNSGWVGLPPP
jgi:hypothetical protein